MKGVSIMLLNKIAETRETLEEYRQLDIELRQVQKVSTFSQLAKTELNKIKSILASFHALNQMDPETFQKKKLSYELNKLVTLMNSGIKSYNIEEVYGFSKLFRGLDDDLRIRWSSFVLNKNKDIIGLLKNLQNIVTNPQEIKQLIADLQTFEKKWPVNSITLKRYHDYLNHANKVISEMDVSENVQDFITKVAANQATLDDLTDEVITWIRSKQLTNKLVIKFR
jgi:hypothetical protein